MADPRGQHPDLVASTATTRALFGAAACSCALVDDEGATLTFVAADGEGAAAIVGVELPVGRGLVGWTAMSGQPLAVRDVRADPRFAADVAAETAYVPTSVLAAPMFDDEGEVLGVLEVLDPTVSQPGDWSLAVVGALASQVARLVIATRERSAAADARLAELGRRVLELSEDHRR